MKNLKRTFILFVALLMGVFAFASVKAAPTSVTVVSDGVMYDASGGEGNEKPYLVPSDSTLVENYTWKKLKTSDGKIAYCIDVDKTWPDGTGVNMNVSNETVNAGLIYILKNGYPNKRIVDGGDKDRYITQGAVWLYMKHSTSFGGNLTDTYNLIPHMVRLVNEANAVDSSSSNAPLSVNLSTIAPEMSIAGDYYVSSAIKPTIIGASTYKVTLTGASGAEAMTTSGVVKTEFVSTESFKVRVPKTVGDNQKVTAKVTISGTTYILSPGTDDSTKQRVVVLYEDEGSAEKTVDLITYTGVCVEYKIVGNVIPDPAKTDPTPEEGCLKKGTKYDQKKELTTRTDCTFTGWFLNPDLTGRWTDGTPLEQDLILYGAWNCPAKVNVPSTAANTPLIILGVGLICVSVCAYFYIHTDNKKKNK